MSQMAFPVLARTEGKEEVMLALRRRMVQMLTVILFPLLTLLVLLAPEIIRGCSGPRWEPAVVPTQILAAGGAATLVIDAVGPALMAEGRAKALLGFGVGHFVALRRGRGGRGVARTGGCGRGRVDRPRRVPARRLPADARRPGHQTVAARPLPRRPLGHAVVRRAALRRGAGELGHGPERGADDRASGRRGRTSEASPTCSCCAWRSRGRRVT